MLDEELLSYFDRSTGVSTDTRSLQPGELFFALHGPNFNGNRYAQLALDRGASAVVVDDAEAAAHPDSIHVEDTLAALQQLARAYRRRLSCPVLALTGSNGKTTTKELISRVLSQSYRVAATVGNLNNHIGVPLTLLRIPASAEIAVVEMGANHVGEIASLSAIAEPTHGLITNIGRAHLEGFGGIEGVRRGKAELFDWLAANGGLAFVDIANGEVETLSHRCPRLLRYTSGALESADEACLLRARLEEAFPYAQGTLETAKGEVTFISQLPGEHNFSNLATAAAIGFYFKVPLPQIAEALTAYRPENSRSEERKIGEATLLLDAYNANPDSTLAGLRWLASRPESRKVAVLGTLAELGAFAKTAHAEIATACTQISGVKAVYFGESWRSVVPDAQVFTEVNALKTWLEPFCKQSDTVILVKGSRSNRLELALPTF